MNLPLIQQFESHLEQLETAARRGDALSDLLLLARQALKSLTPFAELVIHISEKNKPRMRAMTHECCEGVQFPGQSELETSDSETWTDHRAGTPDSSTPESWNIFCCRALSRHHRFHVCFLIAEDPRQRAVLIDASRTLADVLAEAAARRLLSDVSERIQNYEKTHPFVHRLIRAGTAEQWAQEVAQHAAEYLGQGRISVLNNLDGQWRLMCATGATVVNPASDAVRRNEKTAELISTDLGSGQWIRTERDGEARSKELSILLAQYAALGVPLLRFEKIVGNDGSVAYGLLIEIFNAANVPSESLTELLRHEISEAARLQSRPVRQSGLRAFSTPSRRILVISAVLLVLLMLIPANFEVEVSGQAFPRERRRIFAPDDGIVEELFVNADQRVESSQTLLRLRNPVRELERGRILGEVESTISRLQAIRASRSSAGAVTSGNPASRNTDLSSEEQQLEQKLISLKHEQALIEQQIASLEVTSPIAGSVYQRRLQEQLRARPVQRGQLLMEVVDSDGEWEMVLDIPDAVAGYVRAAGQVNDPNNGDQAQASNSEALNQSAAAPAVQYVFLSDSGTLRTTRLASMEAASYLREERLVCRATAMINVETDQSSRTSPKVRPGQAVTARIYCGRRSLGFVWFREVIEFCQRKKFAWL